MEASYYTGRDEVAIWSTLPRFERTASSGYGSLLKYELDIPEAHWILNLNELAFLICGRHFQSNLTPSSTACIERIRSDALGHGCPNRSQDGIHMFHDQNRHAFDIELKRQSYDSLAMFEKIHPNRPLKDTFIIRLLVPHHTYHHNIILFRDHRAYLTQCFFRSIYMFNMYLCNDRYTHH